LGAASSLQPDSYVREDAPTRKASAPRNGKGKAERNFCTYSVAKMRLLPAFLLLGVASTRSLNLFKRDSIDLFKRDGQATCSGLNAQSNDGNRKIAIVIDSSGSMTENDPYNLRLQAGEEIDNWLISVNEATGNKKADLVTVIDFDDAVNVDYPLGDPGDAANTAISRIDADGGTYIAGGVTAAITQLTSGGSGATKDRSGIIVLTDGEVRLI
jgi:predicted metal-dependent peptidase